MARGPGRNSCLRWWWRAWRGHSTYNANDSAIVVSVGVGGVRQRGEQHHHPEDQAKAHGQAASPRLHCGEL